jgi:HSP20 family protein
MFGGNNNSNNNYQANNTTNDDNNEDWTPGSIPQLTIDMYRKNDIIFIVSTVAGVALSDLDISVDKNVLYIRGIRRRPYNEADVQSEISECFWGEFYREVPIEDPVNPEQIEATLNGGLLVIKIPVIKSMSRKIQVKLS